MRGVGIKQHAHAKAYVSDAACLIRENQAALQLHRSGVRRIGINQQLCAAFLREVRDRREIRSTSGISRNLPKLRVNGNDISGVP